MFTFDELKLAKDKRQFGRCKEVLVHFRLSDKKSAVKVPPHFQYTCLLIKDHTGIMLHYVCLKYNVE